MPTKKTKRYLDINSKFETRQAQDGRRYIDGMIPYNSLSEEMWGFVERIDPSAFRKTLSDGAEVFAFWCHDDSQVLASRSAGTLSLDNRDEGLHFTIEMRDNAISEDRWQAVQRGDVVGTSFGFITEREEWDLTVEPNVRTLKEVRLLEISPGVPFPAYSGAQSGAAVRSLMAEAGLDPRKSLAPIPAEDRESTSPGTPPAPPQPAPGESDRAELEARQRDTLTLIKAQWGLKGVTQ